MARLSLLVALSAYFAAGALASPHGLRGDLNETTAPVAEAAAVASGGFAISEETLASSYLADLSAAAATGNSSFDGWFSIRNENSGKVLTVKCYMWCPIGTEVMQYSIANELFPDTDKQWTFVGIGFGSQGTYALKNKKSKHFLAAAAGDMHDGQAVVLGSNSGALEAQWHVHCLGRGATCTVTNAKSQLPLGIADDSLDNMAAAVLRVDPLPSAAAWRFMPASS